MPKSRAEPLNPQEIEQLADALLKWVNNHPEPDTKVLAFGFHNPSLSPRELAKAIRNHAKRKPSESSKDFLRLVQFGREKLDLGSLIGWLDGTRPMLSQN